MTKTPPPYTKKDLRIPSSALPLNASVEALGALASYVAHEWGEYGYRFEYIAPWDGRGVIGTVCHSDGSRFAVGVNRYGECFDLGDFDDLEKGSFGATLPDPLAPDRGEAV